MNLSHLAPLVRDSALRRQLATYVLSRLPSGMLVLALLLYANSRLPAFAKVGAVVATYTIAVAVIAPGAGRLADRLGARRVLPVAALVHVLGIAIIVSSHSFGPMCVGAVVAGAGLPPTPACLRAQWRQLHPTTRSTVYAVDGIVVEAAHVVGPLLVSVLTAVFSSAVAVATAAACSAVAAAIASALLPGVAICRVRRHWTGPLRFPAVDLLLVVLALVTAAIAIIEVSVVSYASDHGSAAVAGVLFAAMAAGSTVGGLVFAARGARRPARDLIARLCILSALGFALLLVLTGRSSTWLLFVVLAVSNVAISPLFATVYSFVSEVAPDGESAETFTWLSSSNFVAISGGTALGGLLLTHADRWVAYLASVTLLLLAAVAAVAARSVAVRPVAPLEA